MVSKEPTLSDLLGFIDEKYIITFDRKTGIIFVGGKRLEEGRILNLRSEAEFMLQSDLWKILNETIRHMAYETMFTKSQSFEDMRSGKMMLYNLSVIKNILDIFKSYKPKVVDKGVGMV